MNPPASASISLMARTKRGQLVQPDAVRITGNATTLSPFVGGTLSVKRLFTDDGWTSCSHRSAVECLSIAAGRQYKYPLQLGRTFNGQQDGLRSPPFGRGNWQMVDNCTLAFAANSRLDSHKSASIFTTTMSY